MLRELQHKERPEYRMVACDTMTLLQLVCLKHTGEYLPTNFCNSTAWSYTLKDGKKQGKFNPYADNLLTNPFKTLTDTHPIQQKIMREVLHSELKQVFTFKVEIADIYAGMIGIDFRCLLTPDEIQALCWARKTILSQSGCGRYLIHNTNRDIPYWYIWLRDDLTELEVTDIANNPTRRRNFGHGWGESHLVLCLSMLTHNPRIKSVLEKFYADTDGKIKQLQKIVKGWATIVTTDHNYKDWIIEREVRKWRDKILPHRHGFPHCSAKGSRVSLGNYCIVNRIETGYGVPPVKRDTWLYWFMWKIIYDKYNQEEFNYAHRKRTNAKVNFWEHIKKDSGKYIPPDKSKHQERLVTSIIQQ